MGQNSKSLPDIHSILLFDLSRFIHPIIGPTLFLC
jgi:hypothetical protein